MELPHYWKSLCWREHHDEQESNTKLEEELALLLSKKLRDAVEYSSGYGLDGMSVVSGVLDDEFVNHDGELTKEESYDSLFLPALSEIQSENATPSLRSSEPVEAGQEQGETKSDVPVSPRPEELYNEYDWEEE